MCRLTFPYLCLGDGRVDEAIQMSSRRKDTSDEGGGALAGWRPFMWGITDEPVTFSVDEKEEDMLTKKKKNEKKSGEDSLMMGRVVLLPLREKNHIIVTHFRTALLTALSRPGTLHLRGMRAVP